MSASRGFPRWRTLAPESCGIWLDSPVRNARCAAAYVRDEGAKMLDGYIVREQDRAAVQWRASCVSDDALRRQIEARLSEGGLPAVRHGVSQSHRGTGGPCIVCRHTIGPTDVEREVEGPGVFLHAHEACYKPWREESIAPRFATGRGLGTERARRGSLDGQPR
jgi:hypothetical protein